MAAALASRQEGRDPIDLAVLEAAGETALAEYAILEFEPFDPEQKRAQGARAARRRRHVLGGEGRAARPSSPCSPNPRPASDRLERAVAELAGRGYRALAVGQDDGDGVAAAGRAGPARPGTRGLQDDHPGRPAARRRGQDGDRRSRRDRPRGRRRGRTRPEHPRRVRVRRGHRRVRPRRDGRAGRRVRAGDTGGQVPNREGPPGRGADRGHDRRRRQRCPRPSPRRRRHRRRRCDRRSPRRRGHRPAGTRHLGDRRPRFASAARSSAA